MTRKAYLLRELAYVPNIEEKLSPEMKAFVTGIEARAGPTRFPAEIVAGALALAKSGAARNYPREMK